VERRGGEGDSGIGRGVKDRGVEGTESRKIRGRKRRIRGRGKWGRVGGGEKERRRDGGGSFPVWSGVL